MRDHMLFSGGIRYGGASMRGDVPYDTVSGAALNLYRTTSQTDEETAPAQGRSRLYVLCCIN